MLLKWDVCRSYTSQQRHLIIDWSYLFRAVVDAPLVNRSHSKVISATAKITITQ